MRSTHAAWGRENAFGSASTAVPTPRTRTVRAVPSNVHIEAGIGRASYPAADDRDPLGLVALSDMLAARDKHGGAP